MRQTGLSLHIAGSTRIPGETFMARVALTSTDRVDGFLLGHPYLRCDSDSKLTERFDRLLRDAGDDTVSPPHRPPNGNALAERFVRSIEDA